MEKDFGLDQELLTVFMTESLEQLENFSQMLLALEKESNSSEMINELFRIAHSLKGNSGMVGLNDIKESMHAAEDLLDAVRGGKFALTTREIDLLLALVDEVNSFLNGYSDSFSKDNWISFLREPLNKSAIETTLIDPILSLSDFEKQQISVYQESGKKVYEFDLEFDEDAPYRAATSMVFLNHLKEIGEVYKIVPEKESLIDENFSKFKSIVITDKLLTNRDLETLAKVKDAHYGIKAVTHGEWQPRSEEPKASVMNSSVDKIDKSASVDTIRVDSEKLYKLLNTVGDLLSVRAGFEETIQTYTTESQLVSLLRHQMHQFNQTLSNLQSEVMQLRMVPIRQLFSRYPRIVRDLANRSHKEIELITQGEGTEIDKKVMELLVDPLTHIIRNGIDHGIEPPETREAIGKKRTGEIVISAIQEGNNIVIEISDDGDGINTEKVLAKAKKLGLTVEGREYSNEEIAEFLFSPGFSTADKVTDISGRGVGLDVVRTNLAAMNGSVMVTFKRGEGSTFRLVLPLTLAIINAFLVKIQEQLFAIPSHDLVENIVISEKALHELEGLRVINLRNEVISIVDASAILYNLPVKIRDKQPVVIIANRHRKIGIFVDEFIELREIMIKPFNPILNQVRAVSGVSVLGNGQVALVMDPMPLLAM